ncbi:MAG TPA: DUF4878 domain-containing protein [Thermomicrobiales bacterium]|nr:hypothetical protein [Chloroflexota bacterium]HCG29722.1 hypothetical protein [Chloroflexota bacterium]HQX62794.1 DUF4878 domain-containing protein [Thermomicrobiales bacterium]HQZ88919.1 DUF4878 domain-containing protein [Thermomicrobiales bacterium]HRA31676.1 DUF4878 domain-containing protein [Thermomicrobiales bacterium]
MGRVTKRILLFAIVAIALSGCGGGNSGADQSVKDLVTNLSTSNYAGAWDALHPAQQRVVPKDLFIRCGVDSEKTKDPKVDNLEILETRKVNKDLPWVGKVDATEVKIRMLQGEDTREGFYDVVKVDGTWRWTLTTRSLSAFEAGNCPP